MGKFGKQTVLIVHNYYQIPGGEDTVVANEKQMLEEHGHKVVLYSRNNSELKEMNKFKKALLPVTTIFNPRTYKDIKQIIKKEHIDIVHVHNTLSLISPSVYYAAMACKVPVVQTVHNFRLLCPGATFYRDGHICEDCVEHGLRCAVKHSCYRGSKVQTLACVINTMVHRITGIYGKINYICLTEFNKDKLLNLKEIDPKKVFVKPNFVEADVEMVSVEKRMNRYIYAGRLDKLKGIDVLFEAWKLMGTDAPRLIVCGTGPMENWCKDYVQENAFNIDMRGFVPNMEACRLIANSKAMILPTQWYEGFPISIAEAFSVGTPVIVSDLGNAGSIVTEGKTGCKFKADLAAGLVDAIKRLSEYASIHETTYEEFMGKYTEEKNYDQLMMVYKTISC